MTATTTVPPSTTTRVLNSNLAQKIMSADDAAALIQSGDQVGMSGFTGSGYPESSAAGARRAHQRRPARGETFQSQRLDRRLDRARTRRRARQGRRHRVAPALPVRSRPAASASTPARWNISTSTFAMSRNSSGLGFLGKLDVAVVEVTAIREDGALIPSLLGRQQQDLARPRRPVILEVNSWQHGALEGMHDIYYGTQLPPHRKPIPHRRGRDQRIGEPYLTLRSRKRSSPSSRPTLPTATPPSAARRGFAGDRRPHSRIPGREVKKGRLPANLLPLQSGVGNVANAVMVGLEDGAIRGPDRLHRSHAGRHDPPAQVGQDDARLGHRACRSAPRC